MIDIESKEFGEYLKGLNKHRHENYNASVDYAEELAVHAYGATPRNILEKARPREEEEVRQYRITSYQPKTKSKFDEAVKVLKKMFNESLYSIIFPESESAEIGEKETLKEYCEKDYPEYGSLINYLKEVGLKKVVGNPNGYFVALPGDTPESQNEYRKPVIKFYKESQILDASSDFVLFLISGTPSKDAYYMLIDDVNIYWLHEERDSRDTKFIIDGEYNHNFGYLPCWPAGGIIEDEMYKSFFDGAIPFWNDAIAKNSDLDAIYINHAYPHMWAIEIDCQADGCIDGKITETRVIKGNEESHTKACSVCQGTGKQLSKSPFNYFTINSDALSDKPDIVPPAGYISPDASIVENFDKKVNQLMQQGMEALKMHVVVGDNQSGIAKEWDRNELHEMIRDVSDLIFKVHYYNSVYFINRYRFSVTISDPRKLEAQLPDINAPQTFDTITASSLTIEIKEATEAGINSNYISALTKDATNKRFSTNMREREILNCIIDLDPFIGVSHEDKMLMKAEGTVTKEDVIVSNNIKKFVYRAISENENFLDLSLTEKWDIVYKYANEITGSQGNLQIDVQQGIEGENIDTPIDIEAESKAKLKGSVGGVQGILRIQQSVAEGITQYDAALSLLNEIYGFDDATGKSILGNKKQINDSGRSREESREPNSGGFQPAE